MDSTMQEISSLYVGELAPEVTDDVLWKIFGSYGSVLGVKLCKGAQSKNSTYGYVNYRTRLEAETALKNVNLTDIAGKQCRVMWCMKDNTWRKSNQGNLFVKNIHPDLDSKAMYDAFSAFGPVMSCKVVSDEYGLSKGYGFVQFYKEEHAEEAIKKINGVKFKNKVLFVSHFQDRKSRSDAKPYDPNLFTNVFIKNFGSDWTIDDLKKHFGKFGEITSVFVKNASDGKSSTHGFVNFHDPASADQAVKAMNGFPISDDRKLYVGRAMKKSERTAYLKREHERKKLERAKQYKDVNVYVKNFDENFTEERLKQEFSKFGTIASAKIMRDENGRSKCFGFVCFSKAEEASKALEGMESAIIDGKPIYVALAQSKEERRKLFDARAFSGPYRGPFQFAPPFQLVYPQPAIMPYNTHFHRMNNMQGGRPPGRPVMPQNPGVPMMVPNPRMYNYQQGGARPNRNQPMNFQARGGNSVGVRYPHSNPGYAPRGNVPQTTQVTVNQVVTEPQSKPRRDEKPKVKETVEDDKAGDRVYKLCQQVFAANQFDNNRLDNVNSAVIDYFKGHGTLHNSRDDDVKAAIVECYQALVGSSVDQNPSS